MADVKFKRRKGEILTGAIAVKGQMNDYDNDPTRKRHMTIEIDDYKIDAEVRVDRTFKAIKYELTSQSEINPLDACYCLWLIIKNVCDEAGISAGDFLANYGSIVLDDKEKNIQ